MLAVGATFAGVVPLPFPVGVPPTAEAAPGSPGVMEAPANFYIENFENVTWDESQNWTSTSSYVQTLTAYPFGSVPGDPGFQPGYLNKDGVTTYTADQQWAAGNNCNGLVLKAAQQIPGAFTPTVGQDQFLPVPGPAAGCNGGSAVGFGHWFNAARLLAQLMGRYELAPTYAYAAQRAALGVPSDELQNHVTTSYTTGTTAPGVMLQFSRPIPVTPGSYYQFSVDIGSQSCTIGAAGALPQFSLTQADGTQSNAFSSPINTCAAGTPGLVQYGPGGNNQRTTRVATFFGDTALRATGTTLGVRVDNLQGTANGNDTAFDNIVVLDTTPKLDKQFSTGPLPGGAFSGGNTGTLTFTVTNTFNPTNPAVPSGPKLGWTFTDALPAGLQLVNPSAFTTTCVNGALTSVGNTLTATGDLSGASTSATLKSCTFTVGVTSNTSGTYTNGPGNVTTVGLLAPGSTSISFVAPPAGGVCTDQAYLAQGATSPAVALYTIDLVGGTQTPIPNTNVGGAYSIAYSRQDGNVYGITNENTSPVLYTFSPTTGLTATTPVRANPTTGAAMPTLAYNAATMSTDGEGVVRLPSRYRQPPPGEHRHDQPGFRFVHPERRPVGAAR